MHARHRKKTPKFLIFRGILVFVLALVLSVSSFATVMANTVSAIVVDGNKSYTFNMVSTDLNQILAQAEEQGLEPLGPLDVAEQVENTTTVNVRRGLPLSVTEAGERTNLIAYRGDSVLKTLEDNNVILKDEDEVLPSREALVQSGLEIEIRRFSQVTVVADGETTRYSMVGGTVANILEEAGITLGQKDVINYDPAEALFDSMIIRVSRPVRVTVTADGQSIETVVTANSVLDAVKKCGIVLFEHDRLSEDPKAKPVDGMEIIVTRVFVEEVTETEEIEYDTEYVDTDDLYVGETQVETSGETGEKKVTYRVTYVEGELESKEVISEEVIKEPVGAVVLQGTKQRPYSAPPATSSGAGTFVDMYGNTVAYREMMIGECTAACIPGGTTSIGMIAQYGVIAVNPAVIPYGTHMYVVSPDGSVVYGYGVAGDTGGALLSGRVLADCYYDTIAECSQIGRRNMIVYLLD